MVCMDHLAFAFLVNAFFQFEANSLFALEYVARFYYPYQISWIVSFHNMVNLILIFDVVMQLLRFVCCFAHKWLLFLFFNMCGSELWCQYCDFDTLLLVTGGKSILNQYMCGYGHLLIYSQTFNGIPGVASLMWCLCIWGVCLCVIVTTEVFEQALSNDWLFHVIQ